MVPEFPKFSLVRGADNKSRIQSKRSIVEETRFQSQRQDAGRGNLSWDASKGDQGLTRSYTEELGQIMSLSPPFPVAGERGTVVICVHQEQVTGAATDSATRKQLLFCSQP